jgi:hypothetical protein
VGGEAGIKRMESALSETRSKFLGAEETRKFMAAMVANAASPMVTSSPRDSDLSENREDSNMDAERTSHVVKSLSIVSSSPSECSKGVKAVNATLSSAMTEKMPTANEQMVNEMLHGIHSSPANNFDNVGSLEGDFKVSSDHIIYEPQCSSRYIYQL